MHKTGQHLTPRLQQGMADHNLQEPLQPITPMFDNIITEPIRKHLPWKWRDRDARRLSLEHVAEVFEIGVATAHDGVLQLEGGDVGSAYDLVVCVHAAPNAVSLGVFDLR